MSQSLPSYDDWKAPKTDGAVLVWPEGKQIVEALKRNDALQSPVSLHGQSLASIRAGLRTFVGHDIAGPLIMTGHQAELHHPGVWSKNVLIDLLARRTNGRAVHLTVDTDQPKHLNLRWPGFSVAITDDELLSSAKWTGLLAAPSPAHLDSISQSAKSLGYESVLDVALQSMRKTALEGHEGTELPAALAMAMHAVDWSLGLDYSVLTLSPLLESDGWLLFASHVLSSAREFGTAYNAALADYRTEQGITTHSRPMPDLVFTSTSIESPLWLDELDTGKRHRATVEIRNGKLYLHRPYTDDAIELNSTDDAETAVHKLRMFLRSRRLRLAPRALTLTLFVRLLLADMFVHGIGGGRYDQVTDRLIATYFRSTIPPFAVTTATLFNPASIGRRRACIQCVLQEGHKLKHDLPGKKEVVAAITSLPRKSPQRQEKFFELQRELRNHRQSSAALKQWSTKLQQTQADAEQDDIMFDRELYFALQTRERLTQLIDRYRALVP
jgi:hypothetical protein